MNGQNGLQDWYSIAKVLGERISNYSNGNAVIAAVPPDGLSLGYHLSSICQLPLEIVPCKSIQHPSRSHTSIGSVSLDEAVIRDDNRQIPQDYVTHQIIMTRQSLYNRYHAFTDRQVANLFSRRTVILVDNVIVTGDTMLACIKSIRRQRPDEIVVVTPFANPQGLQEISPYVDRIEVIKTIRDPHLLQEHYCQLPKPVEDDLDNLLAKARQEFQAQHA
jgi:putative phosphoribosyl transferase